MANDVETSESPVASERALSDGDAVAQGETIQKPVNLQGAPHNRATLSGLELAVVALLGGLPPFTMEIYIPSLPSLQTQLHTTPRLVMLTLSVYQACFSGLQVILGPISDVYGRRPVLLGALTFYVGASGAAMFAPTIEILIVLRSLQAVGSASAAILSIATLRDRLDMKERQRVTSKLAMVRSTAPLLAPVVGSLLEVSLGWRSSFGALGLLGLLGLYGAFSSLPESLTPERQQPSFNCASVLHGNLYLVHRREFLAFSVPEAVGFGGLFCWISSSSFVLQDFYQVPVVLFGLIYCVTFVGSLTGAYIAPRMRLLGLPPHQHYVTACTLNAVIAALLAAFASSGLSLRPSMASQLFLQACMFLYALGTAVSMVHGQVLALEPFPTRAATAAGLMGAMRTAISCAATLIMGAVHDNTPRPMCIGMAIFGVSKLLLHLLLRPPPRTPGGCATDLGGSLPPAMEELKRAHEAAAEDTAREKHNAAAASLSVPAASPVRVATSATRCEPRTTIPFSCAIR